MIKYTFAENNNIPYFQDFSFSRGIPANVEFLVETPNFNRAKLTGNGYGIIGGNYGNGAIFVSFFDLPKDLQDLLQNGVTNLERGK